MEWYLIPALIGAGFAAGFINTVAGGGSIITLPLLMFTGLPSNVANGTNRISILFQSLVGINTFRKNKIVSVRNDFRLAIPAGLGAALGAFIAVKINEDILKWVISGLMVLMLLMVIFDPDAWVKERAGAIKAKPSLAQNIIFFFIGLYGGFIQVGVGFFLLGGLVLGCGYDLVKANAVKVLIVFVFTVVSLTIFLFSSQVNILAGVLLACGSMTGAWIGARFAIKGGARYVRYFLIATLILMIFKLFGVFG
jgi:uncharacterized protein